MSLDLPILRSLRSTGNLPRALRMRFAASAVLPALLSMRARPYSPRLVAPTLEADAAAAKAELLNAVAAFDEVTAADGTASVDFGVKGGELDSETRAPRDLATSGAFYAVSDRVGAAADRVLSAIDAVALVNPTPSPTSALGVRH